MIICISSSPTASSSVPPSAAFAERRIELSYDAIGRTFDFRQSVVIGFALRFSSGDRWSGVINLIIDRAGNDPLHFIAKLADIAFPIADHQQIDRLRRKRDVVLAETGRIVIDVIIDYRRYLRPAFA